MNTFFGMIVGCLLTIAVVYVHDTMATSTGANGNSQTIVNWNVAASEWSHVESGVRTAWLKLQSDYNKG